MVHACHDLSEGGLAVAAAEMCIGGRFGLDLQLEDAQTGLRDLFGETNGCLLVEVSPEGAAAFETLFAGLPLRRLGRVTAAPELTIRGGGDTAPLLTVPVDRLLAAWQATNER
jgi:phosphoribosylformylglycinamidine synthase